MSAFKNKTTGAFKSPPFLPEDQNVNVLPNRHNVWIFIMAGQSNMAGRGQVSPEDTIPSPRVFTLGADGELLLAKEPLHHYEPALKGLDCGLTFGKTLTAMLPDSIHVLLVPVAVGGSAISQWLGDSLHRSVKLLTNFREKVAQARAYGEVKAVLWHQGESDAAKDNRQYTQHLGQLLRAFRQAVGNDTLPVVLGGLGHFSQNKKQWASINKQIRRYCADDENAVFVKTKKLEAKADRVHFNAQSQRKLGQMYARAYAAHFMPVAYY